jgi:hypothetical protein
VVLGYAGKRAVIQLIDVWDSISGGESIAKAAHFAPFYCDRLAAPDAKVQGAVVYRVEDTVTPYLQQYLIIDKGADAGVKLGDFFRVMEKGRPNRLSEQVLEAQAVNVTPASATLVVLKLYKDRLNIGDEALLSMRAVAATR